MLDRYGADGPPAIAFLQGYGLKRGALGTTYNPMYHNVLVAGVDDADMATAANALAEMGGGFVAVEGDEVVAVPLPLCGLMSDAVAEDFLDGMRRIYEKARDLGCSMESPFHNLAFTTVCGELPFFKLSHEGPFDVAKREVRQLLVEQSAILSEA
jgi:adenine deaminase